MEPKKKSQPESLPPQKKKSVIDSWIAEGVPCYYARFQSPVAPAKDKEPVSEFYMKSANNKYVVNQMVYTPHGLIFWAHGECDITPLTNIQWARFTL